jgi:hypothetical protein
MEKRGLRIDMDKTMVMVTGKIIRQKIQSGRWPCGNCGRGGRGELDPLCGV